MTLKIIGAGFPRTGTLSLKAALETLGYGKCHHMSDVLFSPRQIDDWCAIAERQNGPHNWDAVFEGYSACVDFPSALYVRELAEAYPDAKVILTVRPPRDWYDSMASTLYKLEQAVPSWVQFLFPRIRKLSILADKLVWQGVFEDQFENKAYAITEFERHIDEVKAAIPKDRLLVMEVKDGWAPLCVFLGVDEPDQSFPRENDKETFQKMIRNLKRLSYVPAAIGGVLALGVLVVAISLFQ
tara:strand:+ start:5369 stop:6091 length:723 start_codon:yes stop_codon:yes gene_type:complete